MINPGQVFTQVARLQRSPDILKLIELEYPEELLLYLNKFAIAIPAYKLKVDFVPVADFDFAINLLHKAMEIYKNKYDQIKSPHLYLMVVFHMLNHVISLANIILERQTSGHDKILSKLSEIYIEIVNKIHDSYYHEAGGFLSHNLFESKVHPKLHNLIHKNDHKLRLFNTINSELSDIEIKQFICDKIGVANDTNIHDKKIYDKIMNKVACFNSYEDVDIIVNYLMRTATNLNDLINSAKNIIKSDSSCDVALRISVAFIRDLGAQAYIRLLNENKIELSFDVELQLKNLTVTVTGEGFYITSLFDYEIMYNECRFRVLKGDMPTQNIKLNELNFKNIDEFYAEILTYSCSQNTRAALNNLLDHANHCNNKQDKQHMVSMVGFDVTYSCGLYVLTQTMGIDAISLMKTKLTNTVAPLIRMLEPFYTIPKISLNKLADYYASFKKENKLTIEDKLNFLKLLNLISLWQACEPNIKSEHDDLIMENLNKHLIACSDISVVCRTIGGILCQYLFGFTNIKDNEINHALINAEAINRISMYATAYPKMIEKDFKQIFLDFVRQDLFDNGNKNNLINLLNKHEEGVKLIEHNKKINNNLKSKGFNIDSLLNYDKKCYFYIDADKNTGGLNMQSQKIANYKLLLSYFKMFVAKISDIKSPDKQLKTILSHYKIIKSKFDKLEEGDMEAYGKLCESEDLTIRFASINKILSKLWPLYPASICEFANHYVDAYRNISQSTNQTFFIKNKNKSYHFRIEQWDKMNKDTYFLGNYTGCCLATNGAYFEAMVQRRMDDGMLFHVAIDEVTGKPAALIWLYLAETSNNTIALVSNFFEVNNKYTSDEVRVPLLEALLHFTKQYCQDNPQLDGFHMARLNYGHNMHDLHKYISNGFDNDIIDKIGGPLILSRDNEDMTTSDIYYLASLESGHRHFNRLDEDKLNLHSSPSLIDIKQLITDVSQREYKNHQSVEQLVQYIKNNYLLAIAPFFESHAELEDYIINVIENNKISYGLAKLSA